MEDPVQKSHKLMFFTVSKYPKKNLDCSLTLQNLSQKERLGFESDVYHFDTCPRLLGLRTSLIDVSNVFIMESLKKDFLTPKNSTE